MKSLFLTNYTNIKFLDKIRESLRICNSFSFSVSFIKKAGLLLLSKDMEECLKRGCNGRIITSTYQNFTDPASLELFDKWMNKYPNFVCHLDLNCFGDNGFHSKGYIFDFDDHNEFVVGSSNITRYALLKNIEWDVSISASDEAAINDAKNEFNDLWEKTLYLDSDLIEKYQRLYDYSIEKWDMDYVINFENNIVPNSMQKKALKDISKLRGRGINKALIIAATGSGKTYLAAFDAKNFDAKRLLFVVHRDTIINDALKTFRRVFGTKVSYGLFNGKNKDLGVDFLFSTNLTLTNNLDLFEKDEFDYIVIDEVHHASASTYQAILNYFNPEFLLGLTATPERMDDNSIFDLFGNNVPYELRLRDAIINDLIVPFKYYGIDDTFVDYSEENVQRLIRQISNNTHCEFVKEKILQYKDVGKLKALGFCRTVEHARLMSEQMNNLGFKTTYLSGSSDTGTRIAAYKALESDSDGLEIIFSVDILNEGIDIPGINMVLFLRPTESSIIFTQQLGRGLRKYDGKEYLTVLDFIGNSYKRSVQIALALGALSKNNQIDKRLLSFYVSRDFQDLDLPVKIHFDALAKEKILNSIESTPFNTKIILEQEYHGFKNYLNRIEYVKCTDFLDSDVAPDIFRYINKYGSYYNFLITIKEDVPLFNKTQVDFIKYLSDLLPLVRPYEYLIVKSLINGEKTKQELVDEISSIDRFDIKSLEHALDNLQNKLYSEKEQKLKYQFVISKEKYKLNVEIDDVYKEWLLDLIEFGLNRYNIDFYDCKDVLNLYYTYDRTSLLTALNNHTLACREGIAYINNEAYFFIDLKKDQSKDEWLKYKDKFLNKKVLQWESQIETTLDNTKGIKLLSYKKAHIFIRKIKKEDGVLMPYIYIGVGDYSNPRVSDNPKKAILIDLLLEHEIPEYLQYDFEIEDDKYEETL